VSFWIVMAGRAGRGSAGLHDHIGEAFVEQQLVDGRGIVRLEVIPRPSESQHRVGERIALGHQLAADSRDAASGQRVGDGQQRLHGVAAHVIADGWIAAPHDTKIAIQYAALESAMRHEARPVPIVGPQLPPRDGGCEALLIRRRHEVLAGIVRVERIAARIDDEHAPMSVGEFRRAHDRVDGPTKSSAARALHDVNPGRGPDDDRRGAGTGENERDESLTAHGP
jgi:hypothetical protein